MTTSKQYDYLNRLSSISSSPSSAFNYQYNAANQRTLDRLGDGSYWRYGYDALGQVTSGKKYWSDQTPVAGQQFGYAFDTIGNRTQTQAGGDQNGANLRVAGYTNNLLNQITSRGVPGDVDVMGDALATSGVTVNTLTAYRKGEYFREQLSVGNTSTAIWQSVTTASPGQTSVTGNAYVAKTPELYNYDADGNLLTDGRWTYAWDGENRLLSMTSLTGAPAGSQLQLNFAYDYQGRRIQKSVWTWNGTSWIISGSATNYAYDGWNCIAALNSTPSLLESFLWGSDLSGSLQGAGGVGGLLEVSYYGTPAMNCFVAFDGNGNASALVNAANGATVANYEYGPFGEVIRATGPMAKANPFRWSTRYQDDESDLVMYPFRPYNPSTGRWLSRDPIGERGGLNLYCFVANDSLSKVDAFGLSCGGKCGVEGGIKFIGEGWTVTASAFSFKFDIVIKFKKGKGYDPACCRYIQWVQNKTLDLNGQRPTGTAAGGGPNDGKLHVDAWPYKGDDDTNPSGGIYQNQDTSGEGYKAYDTPGWGGFHDGDAIDYDTRFRGTVIDICNGNKVVAKKDFKITATGTWPKLTYDP